MKTAILATAVALCVLFTLSAAVGLPSCEGLGCKDCLLANASCGFCTVGSAGACKALVAANGTENLADFCARENGTVVDTCPAPPPPACDVSLPCNDCMAKELCGYCQIGDYGKCIAKAGENNLTTVCATKNGTVTAAGQCPVVVVKPPPAPYCDKMSNCSTCTSNAANCGYCVYNKGYSSKCMAIADNITGVCGDIGGTLYTSANADTCPAPPICSAQTCDGCIADSQCGSCTYADRTNGRVYSKCAPKVIPDGVWLPNITKLCGEVKGVIAGATCPIIPSLWQCVEKDCAGCTRDPTCGFCSGTFEGKTWGACKPLGTVEGFCTREIGNLSASAAACAAPPAVNKTNVAIVDKLNSEDFSAATLNIEINKDAGLGDLVVVIQVVTSAEPAGEGKGKFDALLDVSGDATSDASKTAVCNAVKKGVGAALAIRPDSVECSLTLKSTSQKRAVSSYAAAVTVDGRSASGRAVASLALVAAAVIAALSF